MKPVLLLLIALVLMMAFVPYPQRLEKFRSGNCDANSVRKAQLPVSDFHKAFAKQTPDFRLAM